MDTNTPVQLQKNHAEEPQGVGQGSMAETCIQQFANSSLPKCSKSMRILCARQGSSLTLNFLVVKKVSY